jgi:hypothetical protein
MICRSCCSATSMPAAVQGLHVAVLPALRIRLDRDGADRHDRRPVYAPRNSAVTLAFALRGDPATKKARPPRRRATACVAFTTASAFSPTDAMPLSVRIKTLMLVQAIASFLTVGVVAARAVNILNMQRHGPATITRSHLLR